MRFLTLVGLGSIGRHVGDGLIRAGLGVRIPDRQPIGAPSSDRPVGREWVDSCDGKSRKPCSVGDLPEGGP